MIQKVSKEPNLPQIQFRTIYFISPKIYQHHKASRHQIISRTVTSSLPVMKRGCRRKRGRPRVGREYRWYFYLLPAMHMSLLDTNSSASIHLFLPFFLSFFLSIVSKMPITIKNGQDRLSSMARSFTAAILSPKYTFPASDNSPKVEGRPQGNIWGLFHTCDVKNEIGASI